ncbi:MAG: amidohydrolase family protein [Anaerolineae bacterium]
MTHETVDLLIHNGIVVTMNEAGDIYEPGAIAINGDTIVAVGPLAEVSAAYQGQQTIDGQGCVISPGLVNAHTHVPMTLLRGLADDLRLDVWLYGYMMPVEREFVSQDFSRIGTLLACAEMLRSGVTTFCDMYYYEDQVAQATAGAGMRAVCAQTILKFPAPDATSYDESLAYCRTFIERWLDHPLIVPAVGPHAPYTSTPDMLRDCTALATEYDVPLHIHVAETAFEQENSRQQYEMPVTPWLNEHGVLGAKVIAAHCVHLERDEMRLLHQHRTGVAHCPSSNLKLASGVAPVQEMLDLGLHVGIGTDGPASNNDLDMFEETRLAAFLQKGIFGDPTLLPAKTAWAMATIEGARALHLDHLAGSLEVGKRADIAVIELGKTHQTPRFARTADAVYSQLVYAAKSSDVRDVVVNGQLLLHDRQLTRLDEAALQEDAARISKHIDAFLSAREGNPLSKLLAISGGIVPQETFEIQVKVRLPAPESVETTLVDLASVTRSSVRNQYDTYFMFDQGDGERLRFREDEVLDRKGQVREIFYTLTLLGPAVEREFDNSILLRRSRYTSPADKSLRFYREYFQATDEKEVHKHRRRYHIAYKDTHFAVNLDALTYPEEAGHYLEVKSRTWSARDAEHKARLIRELLESLGIKAEDEFRAEYVDMML